MTIAGFNAATIQEKYDNLGFQSGWTFLCCNADRLKDARIAIVGLNPGGRDDEGPYGKHWATGHNPYYDEFWGGKNASGKDLHDRLQLQIQKWHDLAGIGPEESLCAQFVPFRTRDWEGVSKRAGLEAEVLAFSRNLWAAVLSSCSAKVFITMGKVPARELAMLLNASPEPTKLVTGWGSATIDLYAADDGRKVIGMPHPSRYTLFHRAAGESDLAEQNFLIALGTNSTHARPIGKPGPS
jgi:hypothetical protein